MLRSFFLLLFISIIGLANAQYKKGDWYVSPKISFADYSDKNDWDGYSISKIPPVSLTVEYGTNDWLSLGGMFGFNRDKYKNDTLTTNIHRYNKVAFGGLASVHLAGWIEKWSNYSVFLGDWDFYVTGGMLLEWSSKNEKDVWNEELQVYEDFKETDVKFKIRPAIGVRYFVTDDVSMLVEVGRANLGLVTTGLTWRL
ncbi:outer membrane beta-barrel protein [Carboxylicivirga linearis]|uniref:Outer membrane beta-barrel protein n=1 Tax=Carboxylicivirga linearis TaxID=1628157 RepID=A0ABS5JTU2_9BACT|nr:outer membrane beta-barrel protein [Carboxylicivirga linearis]MBS2097876.1 outer membrane beta-barrel protein [Carboxylicivirga linearis]